MNISYGELLPLLKAFISGVPIKQTMLNMLKIIYIICCKCLSFESLG